MSATNTPSETYPCSDRDCNTQFPPREAVAGSYCSTDCHHRHKGRKLLHTIQYDHKYCSNCGRQLKEIATPTKAFLVGKPRHAAESIVGFEYTTPHADTGAVDVRETPGRETVATGVICGECGNTNQSECFPEDHTTHLLEYGQLFLDSLRAKRREGVHDKHVDDAVFFEALVESGELAVSLGRAINT